MEKLNEVSSFPKIAVSDIKDMLDKYRETLSDEEFELLVGLHECHGSFERLSQETGSDASDLYRQFQDFWLPKVTRIRKDGKKWRTRLSPRKIMIILEDYDLTESEKKILEARIQSQNNMLAAIALGMTYGDYHREFQAIRDRYGL